MGDDIFRLKEVIIKGYKSIAFDMPVKLGFNDTTGITVLLGANGSGKSNIISFFRLLSHMMSGNLQRFVEESGTNQTFLHYGAKTTPTLCGTLRFENSEYYDIYEFSLTHAQPDRLIVSSERVEWGRKAGEAGPQKLALEANFKESALIQAKDKGGAARAVWRILSGCKVYQFHDSSAEGPLRQASTVDAAHYLQSQGNNLASFLYYLQQNYAHSYRRIVSYVQMVMPQFKDFYLKPARGYVSLKWLDCHTDDYVFTPYQFSDGTIRFIALAALLLQPAETMPGVVIIDEPELGLHPYAVDRLVEMCKDAALHAQVMIATQSPALIDGFDIDDIAVVELDEEKQATSVRNLNRGELEGWLEHYSASELWDKNVLGGRPV